MTRRTGLLIGLIVIAVAAVVFLLSQSSKIKAVSLKFDLPIDCLPGANCWIANYVDSDPGPGASDYAGGPRTYNKHKGVDIAVRDRRAITDGVAVLAAADGVIRGSRNNMPDIDFRKLKPKVLKGRECGNGVVIDHGRGWTSQYCHLRRGSIQVKKDQMIKSGDKIGFVGLSGKTMFPHLHFQVFLQKNIIDPFTGKMMTPIGKGANESCPLWRGTVSAQFPYRGSEIYIAGFAASKPSATAARRGDYRIKELNNPVAILYFWSDIFSVRNGDRLIAQLFDAANNPLSQRKLTFDLKKTSARRFIWIGFKHKKKSWPKGGYRVDVGLSRKGIHGEDHYQASRTVTIN